MTFKELFMESTKEIETKYTRAFSKNDKDSQEPRISNRRVAGSKGRSHSPSAKDFTNRSDENPFKHTSKIKKALTGAEQYKVENIKSGNITVYRKNNNMSWNVQTFKKNGSKINNGAHLKRMTANETIEHQMKNGRITGDEKIVSVDGKSI